MLIEKIKNYKVYLCSKSPRRHELLAGMDIQFEYLATNMDESHPEDCSPMEIAEYLSKYKLSPIDFSKYSTNSIFIACDTIVVLDGKIIEKPENEVEAYQTLQFLSGKEHTVVSGLTVANHIKSITAHKTTAVKFKEFTPDEINYYVENYKPIDKAGSYGIQEWIGYIGIESIQGSFYNVMGLPTKLLYDMLEKMVEN